VATLVAVMQMYLWRLARTRVLPAERGAEEHRSHHFSAAFYTKTLLLLLW
jgi:hypothetical protein